MSSPITTIGVASPIAPASASASTLWWSMEQMQRPSDAHSGLILASHVAFAVGLITAARQRQAVEGAVLAAVVMCSLLYHVCDENIYCAAGRDIRFWHAADVWGTFVLSLAVLGVACLRLPQGLASLVRVLYVVATTTVVATDPGSPILLGALLLSLVVALAVRHLVLAHRYPIQGDGALLLKSLGSYVFAQVVFLLANDPQWGGGVSDYVPAVHGATKPMHIPDTRVYWLYHSLWHVGAAYAAHYALLFAASSSVVQSAQNKKKLE